jgi:hypothetical protein
MSVRLIADVLDHVHGIPTGRKLLLVCLADHANDQGISWPSQQTLARRMGVSDRQVRTMLVELVDGGLVEVIPRGGKSNYYKVLVPRNSTSTPEPEFHPGTEVPSTPEVEFHPPRNSTSTHPGTTVPTEPSREPSNEPSGKPQNSAREKYPPEFDRTWSQIPSGHGSKKKTYDQWRKLSDDDKAALEAVMPEWVASRKWREGFVKDPAVWIRDDYWRNPPAEQPRASSNGARLTPKEEKYQRNKAAYLAIANGDRS